MTKHTEEFKEFVSQGINKEYFIGIGNPYANILFVGKESAIKKNEVERMSQYLKNANEWRGYIENNSCEILNYPVENGHVLRAGWGKNTWSKYQKLTDIIFEKEMKPFHVDFLENVFTTEINDSPEKNTANADKTGLNERKQLFKESKFIQNFPVVVLACSNYIRNNDKIREIDKIFGVKFVDGKQYTSANWFYTHYSEDGKKLVIHTRQLSANVKPELLKDMGQIIRQHLDRIQLFNNN
ncbi:hypothetical protein HYN59_02870 [Flavobacterium album]|uniref:Uncharacterized protein n=1 Tax=Flavobacterium album TaxID=2175091 RepID=A0A2S1QUQ2_9FLAO|nr:hypothetical protein [Flavobacterium album]AWH84115.1 hypothetical protein HYN59_02870 [Flavobacterium album]